MEDKPELLEMTADIVSAYVGNNSVSAEALPTLIASIYGMNFEVMPELDEPWGYPMALGLMATTAAATWLVLRWKHWL